MSAGEHKPEYRAPRTGEKRKVRQPFDIDKLSEEVRKEIQKRRAEGQTLQEISDASPRFAGQVLSVKKLHTWLDVRFEQVMERSERMEALLRSKHFENLPETAKNALASSVFSIVDALGPAEQQAALGNLGFVLSKMIAAQAAAARVKLEREKVDLARRKFDELKSRADKATNEAAAKVGKGRQVTIDDINRIRERTFGLPPIQRAASSGPPA